MARSSTSLDLSEFFSNDDSDGQRLAEFLQKRRGGVKRQNFLFMNCEPQRLSLNVQLEKLPPSHQEEISENNEKQIENVKECDKNVNDEVASVERLVALLHGESERPHCPNNEVNEHVPTVSNVQPLPFQSESPSSPDKLQGVSPPPSSIKPLSPRPLSPRLSHIRKSGGVSPSDRLRRYSLKRLTKIGRRTLLQEFESTVSDSNFDPPVCSTPISQPLPDKTPCSQSGTKTTGTENEIPNGTENNPSINESCCGHTDTLIRTLERKDEELKNYMESIFENTARKIQSQEKENSKKTSEETQTNSTLSATKSPLKRTYTIEKGNVPGQVILTPDRTTKENFPHDRQLRSQTEHSSCKIMKTPERGVNRSMISIRVKSPQSIIPPRHLRKSSHNQSNSNISHRGLKMLEVNRSRSQKEQQATSPNVKMSDQVPNTPPGNNFSIFPTQDVEIPEAQDVPPVRENSIIIRTDNVEMPLVVIPINQTYNRTYDEEIPINNLIIKSKTKQSINSTNAFSSKQTEQTAKLDDEQSNQLAEDNLKLTDILTDDDDYTPKAVVSRNIENNSQTPLNLAPSATNIRKKRLRKRSISRRRLQMGNSQLLSIETETELRQQAHSSRRMIKKKHIPLNKAPGTPLNGEKFAQELARMSNYEILDLRKRNSMGRVFAISRHKSLRSYEEVVKKQNQLDGQIEKELLKRNLDEATDIQHTQNYQTNVGDGVDVCPPAPDEFRDSLNNHQNTQNGSRVSSLIDEKSTDRISFKNKRHSLQQTKASKKQIPEVLKQYLEVSKMLTKKKNGKYSINKSKRSLYTQGRSDSEEANSSIDKSNLESTRSSSRLKKQSIPYVPSPPKSDVDEITTLKVVSPPPPLNITPRKSVSSQAYQQTTADEVEENSYDTYTTTKEHIPPPPPGFESDSGVSSNHFHIHSTTTNSTLQTNHLKTTINRTLQLNTNNSHIDIDDDHIFKKPQQAAPKKRGRKVNVSKIPLNGVVQSASDSQESADNSANTTDGTLRRSKRGQVPLKHPLPLFQIMFQKTFNRRLEMLEKRKQKEKQKSREISRTNKAHSEKSYKNSDKTTNKSGRQRTQLQIVPENEPYIDALKRDIKIMTKKKTTQVKESKVKRKQNTNKNNREEIQQNDNFECSRIIMNTPPPVDHLNNVFDQLRNTSSALSTSPPRPQPTTSSDLVSKVKPFKIRLARIKSSTQPTGYNSVVVSSSSIPSNSNNNSNYELISWLRNITESESILPYGDNEEIFKEMRISAACNLSFTELQGVEYAFYDTDDKASLGYLRFKPRQIKPKKKAKRFHLHFVTLMGNFRITANEKESRIGVGDMVAIEKAVYYDIENITDDIGILMVIKK